MNFHPPFSEHLLSFFSYPSNVDLKHLNQALVLLLQKFTPHFKIMDPRLRLLCFCDVQLFVCCHLFCLYAYVMYLSHFDTYPVQNHHFRGCPESFD